MAGKTTIIANKKSKREANSTKKYFEDQDKSLWMMRGIKSKYTYHIRETKLHGVKRYVVFKKEK